MFGNETEFSYIIEIKKRWGKIKYESQIIIVCSYFNILDLIGDIETSTEVIDNPINAIINLMIKILKTWEWNYYNLISNWCFMRHLLLIVGNMYRLCDGIKTAFGWRVLENSKAANWQRAYLQQSEDRVSLWFTGKKLTFAFFRHIEHC